MSALSLSSRLPLNSGHSIPILGYGDSLAAACSHNLRSTTVCEEVVSYALKSGYRHVDSACAYTNEVQCGEAIRKAGIPREDIFFTSKIPPRRLGYERTCEVVDQTLKLTGLTYIDLMLIHAPYGGSENRKGAWKALVEAQQAGKIRSLGVSNYGVHHLDELETHIKELEAQNGPGNGGVISVGQWELHPWLPRADIVDWCQKRDVVLEAYCPIVRGQRAEDPMLQGLMQKHGKTAAQVLLRWSLQKGFVPLPKSVTPSRIVENADVFNFELDAGDMKALELKVYEPCAWDPTKAALED